VERRDDFDENTRPRYVTTPPAPHMRPPREFFFFRVCVLYSHAPTPDALMLRMAKQTGDFAGRKCPRIQWLPVGSACYHLGNSWGPIAFSAPSIW